VKRALDLLLTRLFALQQQQHSHHFAWQRQQQERGLGHRAMYGMTDTSMLATTVIPGFSVVVRILALVPCCGMIIGKGGASSKQIVDASGVSAVRLSPKEGGDPESPFTTTAPPSLATAERMASFTGPDPKSCLKCLYIILEDGMTSHFDISRYANMTTSYSRVCGSSGDSR
jgi:hypothetical protein